MTHSRNSYIDAAIQLAVGAYDHDRAPEVADACRVALDVVLQRLRLTLPPTMYGLIMEILG